MLSFLTYNLKTTADISIVMYSVYIFFSSYTVPNIMLYVERERDTLLYLSFNHNQPPFLWLYFPLYEFNCYLWSEKNYVSFSRLLWRAI